MKKFQIFTKNHHHFCILMIFIAALSLTMIALPSSLDAKPAGPKKLKPKKLKWKFKAEVVSSAPDQVTGGDARLHIKVPRTVPLHKVVVLVNGIDQSHQFDQIPGTRTLTGVIDGLNIGQNKVKIMPNNHRWHLTSLSRC